MNTTSLYHHDTSGLFSDPLHGHSFVLMNLHSLSSLDSSFLSFRSCLLCHDHLVSVLNTKFIISKRRRRKLKSTTLNGPKVLTDDRVSQCINCSTFIHRDCISFLHYHRNCRHHESLVPVCGQAPLLFPDTIYLPLIDHVQHKNETQMRLWRLETFTLATLIEELDSSNSNNSTISSSSRSNTTVGPSAIPLITGRSTSKQLLTASKVAKKWAPLLAAGGVMGALAMGPAAGVIAGINMLVASVGAETVMAGIGLTASAAAAATVTHQSKLKASQRKRERIRKGEWAMEICWNCKQSFATAQSDEACRKDAEFLRRFQVTNLQKDRDQAHCSDKSDNTLKEALSSDERSLMVSLETMPDDAEVYRFLFRIFASPGELLGQMNVQLCEAFRKRFNDRHQKQLRRSSFIRKSNSAKIDGARTLAKDTLQDTKMYIAHVLGATLQCFPSLASTSQSISSCTLAIERIIYDDIHALVFREFRRAFQDAETAFASNLENIRREEKHHSSALLQLPHQNQSDGNMRHPQHAMLAEDLQKAEAKMITMMQETSSPLLKLMLLCDAFRSICWFAEKLHKSASNTDMLIPILCAFLVQSPRVCRADSDFVAEIAFISFFTNGGGKGVEGYVLTMFQAAIQVIAAVDLPSGHAMELELFFDDDKSEASDETEDDEDKFFDAMSIATRESQLQQS